MIRQIWIAECDLCGHTEKAKSISGRYNKTDYTLPDGWHKAHNKDFILCPECHAKMTMPNTEAINETQ